MLEPFIEAMKMQNEQYLMEQLSQAGVGDLQSATQQLFIYDSSLQSLSNDIT